MAKYLYIIKILDRVTDTHTIEAATIAKARAMARKIVLKQIPMKAGVQDVYILAVINSWQPILVVKSEKEKIKRCIVLCIANDLSVAETNVILMLRLLLDRKEIAFELKVSIHTINTHLKTIQGKLKIFSDRRVEKMLCEQ